MIERVRVNKLTLLPNHINKYKIAISGGSETGPQRIVKIAPGNCEYPRSRAFLYRGYYDRITNSTLFIGTAYNRPMAYYSSGSFTRLFVRLGL